MGSMKDAWVETSVGRIHCLLRDSDGPNLVFLPGAAIDAARLTWKKVIEALPEGYRVIVIDLPGFGESDRPDEIYVSTRSFSGQVRAVLDWLDIHRPVLFAASMGAAVALDLMPIDRDPPRTAPTFRGLVLSAAYGLQGRLPFHEVTFGLTRMRGLAPLLRGPIRRPEVMKQLLRLAIHDDVRITDELVEDAVREAGREHALDTFLAWMRQEVQPSCVMSNFREDLFRMHVPTAVIHGQHDWMMSPSAAAEAVQRMPNAQLHLLDAGHMVPRERPEEVNRIVHDFLKRHAPLT